MSDALRALGAMTMLGIRGAKPCDPTLERDLEACAQAGVRMVLLFSRDVSTGLDRNVRSPAQLRLLTDHVRARLGADAIIAVDQEGGSVQRLTPTHGFAGWPSARDQAGMVADRQVAEARSMAASLREAGVTLNFAPCVDVDINSASPVIGALGRSFSAQPEIVAACAERVIRAHREEGIACVLKHFPGHGSASLDSHHDLVDISTSWQVERELAPYRALLSDRVGVMTGHLVLRRFDAERPASLSHAITTRLLRDMLGFEGPVFTDALDMEGVRKRWSLADTIRLSVQAGADVLVHACNSGRREYAPDVVRAMAAVATDLEAIDTRAQRSAERVRSLTSSM